MEIKFEAPIFDQNSQGGSPTAFNQTPLQSPKKPINWGHKITLIVVILTVFTLGLVSLVFLRNSNKSGQTSTQVSAQVQGPTELASGNEAHYIVVYQNSENADMLGVSMEVFYPSGFTFISADPTAKGTTGQSFELPDLRSGQQGEVNIRGKLTGRVDEEKEIRVRFRYSLSNFNSEFSTEGSFKTRILAPKLFFDVNGPIDVTNGQDITFSLDYSNVSDQEFDNVGVKVTYPPGFKYSNANPLPARDNNYWMLGKLAPGTTGKIDVKGSFTGDPNQEKIVVGELGININNVFAPQIVSSTAFKIVSSSLSLSVKTTPSDFTRLDQPISYNLDYANYGSVGMSNVVISVTLEGAAIDFTKLKAEKAIVTGSTLTWKSATLGDLALVSPNKQGSINFTVPIKSGLTTNLKNQVIKSTAQIYSDQVTNPIRAADIEIKLASDLNLLVNTAHVSGPQPLEPGQPTVYSVTLILTNTSNDLDGVALVASMPLPDTAWKNIVAPDAEKANLTFDPNSSKIRWKVGAMPAFTGKFSPARSVTFQIEVVPNTKDGVVMLKEISASGMDTFINQKIDSVNVSEIRSSDSD